jgi:hypothetical protein
MFRSELSDELKEDLLQQGISPDFINRALSGDNDAIATIEKLGGKLRRKIVHFNYDATTYDIPEEIANAVHNQPSCSPG